MTRHLAAILAADIVGYSAMMGSDQERTLTASSSVHLGRMADARAALDENERTNPGDSIQLGWKRNVFSDTPGTRRYYEGLRLAGMREGSA